MERNILYKLNAFENGWLTAALGSERLKNEMYGLWVQVQLNFSKVYAASDGHPSQKQAKKDVLKYEKLFAKLIAKEEAE